MGCPGPYRCDQPHATAISSLTGKMRSAWSRRSFASQSARCAAARGSRFSFKATPRIISPTGSRRDRRCKNASVDSMAMRSPGRSTSFRVGRWPRVFRMLASTVAMCNPCGRAVDPLGRIARRAPKEGARDGRGNRARSPASTSPASVGRRRENSRSLFTRWTHAGPSRSGRPPGCRWASCAARCATSPGGHGPSPWRRR